MPETSSLQSDQPEFWESRYRSQEMPWDLGGPAPPFEDLLNNPEYSALLPSPPARVAVIGSGAGHDAALFGKAGFEVTGLDYAPGAVTMARQRYGTVAHFEQADLFHLPPAYHHAFDMVVEHTCFCAILPSQRPAYVEAVHQLLKPAGCFIGLFWAHNEKGGPPFKTDEDEIRTLFSPPFTLTHLSTPARSAPAREGQERLCIMVSK
jgi:SAM-dependent methyltransferase